MIKIIESLDEESEAINSSSIGQHKRSSIDDIIDVDASYDRSDDYDDEEVLVEFDPDDYDEDDIIVEEGIDDNSDDEDTEDIEFNEDDTDSEETIYTDDIVDVENQEDDSTNPMDSMQTKKNTSDNRIDM